MDAPDALPTVKREPSRIFSRRSPSKKARSTLTPDRFRPVFVLIFLFSCLFLPDRPEKDRARCRFLPLLPCSVVLEVLLPSDHGPEGAPRGYFSSVTEGRERENRSISPENPPLLPPGRLLSMAPELHFLTGSTETDRRTLRILPPLSVPSCLVITYGHIGPPWKAHFERSDSLPMRNRRAITPDIVACVENRRTTPPRIGHPSLSRRTSHRTAAGQLPPA